MGDLRPAGPPLLPSDLEAPASGRPSLGDVARRARVSPATASRVISGASYPVSAGLRSRVEAAARELAYSPDPLARAMATGRSRTIGVIVGAATDPYFAEITRGAEERARRGGYLTILCSSERNLGLEVDYLRLLRDHRAAGAVLVGGAFADAEQVATFSREVQLAAEHGMTIVSLSPRPGVADVPIIAVDDRRMLSDLAGYLASLGHRRLAFVGPHEGFSTSDARLEGLREGLRSLNLPEPMVLRSGFDYHAGRQAALRLLQSGLPDAIVGFSDETALGVLITLRDAGIDVPGRVSVAGVDSTREAEFVGLTTVSVPMRELGAAAAARIMSPGERHESGREVFPHRIVTRQTTARRVEAIA